MMSRALALAIGITDVLFMTYWVIAGLAVFGLLSLPPDMMYGDYNNPRVVAWNWSFFPLDLAFSVFGYLALSANRRNDPIWRGHALASLMLTMTAGGMCPSPLKLGQLLLSGFGGSGGFGDGSEAVFG